ANDLGKCDVSQWDPQVWIEKFFNPSSNGGAQASRFERTQATSRYQRPRPTTRAGSPKLPSVEPASRGAVLTRGYSQSWPPSGGPFLFGLRADHAPPSAPRSPLLQCVPDGVADSGELPDLRRDQRYALLGESRDVDADMQDGRAASLRSHSARNNVQVLKVAENARQC